MNDLKINYLDKQKKHTAELSSVSKQLKRFAWYRFISFLAVFSPLFIFEEKNGFTFILIVLFIILFFFLIKKNIQLEKRKKKLVALKKIVEDEIKALEHSFSHFRNGEAYLNTEHFFSYDLDLFGEGSLFQFLNRTSTIGGSQKLADWLINPSIKKDEIENRQKAIQELAQIPEWRLQFLTNGKLFEETKELSHEIRNWSEMELELKNRSAIKWLIKIIPIATLLTIIPAITGFSSIFLILMIFTQLVLMYFFWKRINQYFQFFGRKSELLSKYMQLIEIVENGSFQSAHLNELKEKATKPDSATKIFGQLESLVKEFEYRQNFLVGFFLNSIFTWDIRCVYKLWNWHNKNHKTLSTWLDVIAEMDALISIGNYAHNHPKFVFPEINDEKFTFQTKQLGHPLLHPKKRICNDLEIDGWSKVMIITGANMAGKSTFLRTVGVNLILSRIGAPVCAEHMHVTPIDIYTNMRTTDSLLKDESYFFAELKRIKGVLDRLEKGEQIFVILDEMLKGTNSIDKLNGSKELIRKLVEFKSVSLVATHDLKLSEMEGEFPQNVFNKCFEIKIENDDMVFDYLLCNGATKSMNATFLMKKMGII